MDRQISQTEIKSRRNKKLLRLGIVLIFVVFLTYLILNGVRSSINREDITIATVDRGDIEPSIAASGVVVPSVEEMIICPISSQVLEVLHHSGDAVEEGTPLLRLDTQNTQSEYQKCADQLLMQQSQFERLKITNRTYLDDLSMKVKVASMELDRLDAELRNELYLDSLGAGTHDKVNEVKFSYETKRLQLEQLRQQLKNERHVKSADELQKQLEINIASRNLEEIKRTLDNAAIRSPRKAIISYIIEEVGAQVSPGSKVAVVSDLSRFKINGTIADVYSEYVVASGKVSINIGNENLQGIIGSVTPLSKDGTISFTVNLLQDNHPRLRSGLKVDVRVVNSVKENVLRLPNSNFYIGPGEYSLFVVSGEELKQRTVRLGECSFNHVEVIEGLSEGEQIVISDMKQFYDNQTIKLK